MRGFFVLALLTAVCTAECCILATLINPPLNAAGLIFNCIYGCGTCCSLYWRMTGEPLKITSLAQASLNLGKPALRRRHFSDVPKLHEQLFTVEFDNLLPPKPVAPPDDFASIAGVVHTQRAWAVKYAEPKIPHKIKRHRQ